MHAVLLSSGEVGYDQVTVGTVCDYYGGFRSQFYSEFSNKADCFLSAYEVEAERLCRRLLSSLEQDCSCKERIEAAIHELIELASSQPAIARALFIEVHVAGGAALDMHREFMQRFAQRIDAACLETADRPLPSLTGEFLVAVVEQAVSSSLAKEDLQELRRAAPELATILSRFCDREDRWES